MYPLGCCPRTGLFAAAADASLLDQRSWISAFATAWLGLALAILRAAHVFLASPSQEILSGL